MSVAEKAARRRQVWVGKANESEPLMTCREPVKASKPGLVENPGISLHEKPDYCAGGVRHKGGASPTQAVGRNVRTCRPDAKGEPQAAETVRGRVPMRDTGAGRPIVAMRPGNAGGAKGADYLGLLAGQPLVGRSR